MNKNFNFLRIIRKNNLKQILSDEFNNISKNDLLEIVLKLSNFFYKKKIIFFPENNINSISTLISLINSCSKIYILNEELFKNDIKDIIKKFDPDYIVSSEGIIKFLLRTKKVIYKKNKIFTYDGKLNGSFCLNEVLDSIKIKNNFINSNSEIICSTSGTTGKPKQIHFFRDKFIHRALKSNKIYKIKKGNFLISTPFYHSVALKCLFMSLMSKSRLTLIDKFTTKKCKKIFIKENNIIWHTSSSQIKEMIVSNQRNLLKNKNIQCIISCADSLDERFKKIIKKSNLKFFDTYGCTETDGITHILVNNKLKNINNVGKVNFTHSVKILDEKNLPLKLNEIGEICVKTNLFCDKINNRIQKEKYFKTGDLGYFDNYKNLFITGRKKNLIISSGINISPERVEHILKKNKKIKNVVILSNKSLIKGEYLVALIVKKKKLNETQVINYLIDRVPNYCIPRKVYFIKNIPLNNLGKIDRSTLKNHFKFN